MWRTQLNIGLASSFVLLKEYNLLLVGAHYPVKSKQSNNLKILWVKVKWNQLEDYVPSAWWMELPILIRSEPSKTIVRLFGESNRILIQLAGWKICRSLLPITLLFHRWPSVLHLTENLSRSRPMAMCSYMTYRQLMPRPLWNTLVVHARFRLLSWMKM